MEALEEILVDSAMGAGIGCIIAIVLAILCMVTHERLAKIAGYYIVATWFGSGLIRPILLRSMAGTYGSLFAIPLCWLALSVAKVVPQAESLVYAGFCGLIFTLGLFTVRPAETKLGPRTDWKGKTREKDQHQIVIDEVLGMLISCIPLFWVEHPAWYHFGAAFMLFRIFDIVKYPLAQIFENVKNAFGVMMDDAVAGAQAALCLYFLLPLLSRIF
jgi:phosphatidylglycerophosphatase A